MTIYFNKFRNFGLVIVALFVVVGVVNAVDVSTHEELVDAIANADINAGTHQIFIISDIEFIPDTNAGIEKLYVINKPLNIHGQGHKINTQRIYYNATNNWLPYYLFDIRADNVTISNLTVNHTGVSFWVDAKGVSSDENYSWWGGKLIPSDNIIFQDIEILSGGDRGFWLGAVNNTLLENVTLHERDRAVGIFNSKNVSLRDIDFNNSRRYDILHRFVTGLTEERVQYSLGKISSAWDGYIDLADFVVNASVLNKSVSIGTFDISATISGSMTTVRLKYNKSLAQKLSVNESTISIYRRNSTNDWNKLPSTVNLNESYVEANITSFSPFAIAGELLDTDGDGITDDIDACPLESENINYYQDTDGCPDALPANTTSVFPGENTMTSDMVLGISVNFSSVSEGGLLSIDKNASNPVSVVVAGYDVVSDYYNIATTANYTGNLTVCVMVATEPSYRLLHWGGGMWEDITTAIGGDRVCGIVSSLSPFVVVKPISQPSPSISSGGGGGGSGMVLPARPTLYILANDVDWRLNNDALSGLGIDMNRISPEEWPRYRNHYLKVVVLGGYKAIGTGPITKEVFGENLGVLESRSNRWLIGQRFLLFAGSGRDETKQLVDGNLDRIREWTNQ